MPTNYCRHIRPNGRRCQMLALRNKPFCYHHESVNAHHRALNPPEDHPEIIIHPINPGADNLQREPILAEYLTPARAPLAVRFPALEDADSIQVSLSMLLSALGQNRIDTKRATAMAYALQVASINARTLTLNSPHVVTETLRDDSGNTLSPDEDPEEILEAQLLLESIAPQQDDDDDQEAEENFVGRHPAAR
jgi:hypothetical protein